MTGPRFHAGGHCIVYSLFTGGGASQVVLVVMSPPAYAGDITDASSICGSGRSPGGGNGNLLQYSARRIPTDGGDWWAIVHRISKSQIQPK